MNDFGLAVRKAFFDALDGNVTVGTVIPVVDEKLDLQITEHDLYILIGNQTEVAANTKSYFAREISLNIGVFNRRKATNTKTIIENIADQILEIIFLDRLHYGITIASPFKLSYIKLDNAEYNFNPVDAGFEINKQLVFKTRLTQ